MQIEIIESITAHDQHEDGSMMAAKRYEAGKTYDVSKSLAKNLIALKKARKQLMILPSQNGLKKKRSLWEWLLRIRRDNES